MKFCLCFLLLGVFTTTMAQYFGGNRGHEAFTSPPYNPYSDDGQDHFFPRKARGGRRHEIFTSPPFFPYPDYDPARYDIIGDIPPFYSRKSDLFSRDGRSFTSPPFYSNPDKNYGYSKNRRVRDLNSPPINPRKADRKGHARTITPPFYSYPDRENNYGFRGFGLNMPPIFPRKVLQLSDD
ncbi:uncharacterized protein LOC107398398 isoform X2 [Tribolium castaneum]|uniref:uncharacterized protein LOC107398398 isoform X2 n=1 Tax=Tribolium castaneum TaxID=7070 RepID=UPI0030FE8C2A